MTQEIINIVIRIIVGLLSILAGVLINKLRVWVASQMSAEQLAQLESVVKVFVQSAEQMLKENDPTGEKRKAYVQEQVGKLGLNIDQVGTAMLNDMIESAVLEINQKVNAIK